MKYPEDSESNNFLDPLVRLPQDIMGEVNWIN